MRLTVFVFNTPFSNYKNVPWDSYLLIIRQYTELLRETLLSNKDFQIWSEFIKFQIKTCEEERYKISSTRRVHKIKKR